jgi:hypothetical protein
MKKSTFALAALAALLSTSGYAAKPASSSCRPSLPQPTELIVGVEDNTINATWNEVESVENEATKYALEITAHYDDYADVTFAFTAFDDDPGTLNTASFGVDADALDTTVCDDNACTTSTTHHATSVTVKVKGLNPPRKGKDTSQCNPFSDPVSADVGVVAATCPCFDAAFLAQVATTGPGGQYGTCWANFVNPDRSDSLDWRVLGQEDPESSAEAQDARVWGGALDCTINDSGQITETGTSQEQWDACAALIQAAQQSVGCGYCIGDSCP